MERVNILFISSVTWWFPENINLTLCRHWKSGNEIWRWPHTIDSGRRRRKSQRNSGSRVRQQGRSGKIGIKLAPRNSSALWSRLPKSQLWIPGRSQTLGGKGKFKWENEVRTQRNPWILGFFLKLLDGLFPFPEVYSCSLLAVMRKQWDWGLYREFLHCCFHGLGISGKEYGPSTGKNVVVSGRSQWLIGRISMDNGENWVDNGGKVSEYWVKIQWILEGNSVVKGRNYSMDKSENSMDNAENSVDIGGKFSH